MSSPVLNACKRLSVVGLCCLPLSTVFGAAAFIPLGGEYPVAGLLRGDQVFPYLSVNETGGFIVWQDNATDGDGLGISARHLRSDLLGGLGVFRVNEQGLADQQNPRVKLLKNGGAVFVWQGGIVGEQDVYARFLAKDGTFATGDLRVNTHTANQQMNPALAVLPNGNVAITWSSFGQDGSMQGIFAQVLSPSGQRAGTEFQVNQSSAYNQRTPSIAALDNDSFVVAWISENNRFERSIDVYGRVVGGTAGSTPNEFLISAGANICANPTLDALPGGGFMAGWGERDIATLDNAWDVYVRSFTPGGQPASGATKVNSHVNGNHYAPQIARVGDQRLVVWTSTGQDGSREGVFARFVGPDSSVSGPEFQVNTTTASQQIYPAVSSDEAGQFVVAWSSFIGGQTSFDLFAQRYSLSSLVPAAPFISALSSTRLSVTWPDAASSAVSGYELYVDDSSDPVVVPSNMATLSGLAPSTTHRVKLAYRFAGGGRSALSVVAVGTTWGSDENLDGLPDDWQAGFWGNDPGRWPDPKADTDADGATNLLEFMAGTNPVDAASVLRTQLLSTPQGSFLKWNTQLGFIYQAQSKTDLSLEWADVGLPRFAAGATDSLLLEGATSSVYYRVKRLR